MYIKKIVERLLFVVALVAVFGFSHTASADTTASLDTGRLVALANIDRNNNNLSSLVVNPVLEKAALAKAGDMAKGGYFSHNSPTGVTPWYWFRSVGYAYAYAGENLAIDFGDSQSVETAWMNSKLHRENILNGNYTEIGIAMVKGYYQGHETTYIVQLFGKPLQKPTLALVSKKVSTTARLKRQPILTKAIAGEPRKLALTKKKA